MIKDEVRVLVAEYVNHELILYVIQRGAKGLEHLGVVKGGVKELYEHLKSNNLISEVKYLSLPEGGVIKLAGHGEVITVDLGSEEFELLSNVIAEGRRIIDLVRDGLKLITTQK